MRIKDILIGIAITILATLVIGFGIQTFYPSPEYNDFCGDFRAEPKLLTENNSKVVCTQDVKECPDGSFVSRDPNNNCQFEPCNDKYQDCWEEYDAAQEKYSKNIFIITTVLGILLITLGGIAFQLDAVSAGLMGGGVLTIIYGSARYFPYAGDLFRFSISLTGLILVIGLAYWLNKKSKR